MTTHQDPPSSSGGEASFEKLQAELFPEEKLLWHDRPVQGIRFLRRDFIWHGIGVLLLAGAVILFLQALGYVPIPDSWLEGTTTSMVTFTCIFWGVILLPLAVLLLGGYHSIGARIRRRFFYGVTNERILILRDVPMGTSALTSLRIHDVPHLSMKVEIDGVGCLNFHGAASQNPNSPYLVSFYLIPDVRKVYTLIRSIQRTAN